MLNPRLTILKITIYSTQDIKEKLVISLDQKYYTNKRKGLILSSLIKEIISTTLPLIKKRKNQRNIVTSIKQPIILGAI